MILIRIFTITISCITILSGSAYAESLYKAGDKYLSLGANLTGTSTNSNLGFSAKAGYFFTDNIDTSLSYDYNLGMITTTAGTSTSSSFNNISLMAGYHLFLFDGFGLYASAGYGIGFGTNIANLPVSSNGFTYEGGVENKISPKMISYLSFKGSSQTTYINGVQSPSTSNSSYEAGVRMIF